MLDGWLFFWLVVFAVIGVLCLSSGFLVTGLLIYFALKPGSRDQSGPGC